MTSKWFLAVAVLAGTVAVADAQPPFPRPLPPQVPAPGGIDDQWFFRGDPFQPTFIQTVPTPDGPALVFTNEKGTPAYGRLSRDGRHVVIPEWNLTGSLRGNAIVWPNGDFWGR